MPIRDYWRDGAIVFWVDVYGVDLSDVTGIPIGGEPPPGYVGSRPFRKAVKRMGLDPDRYRATLFDVLIDDGRFS
jgi:hypothetical protein